MVAELGEPTGSSQGREHTAGVARFDTTWRAMPPCQEAWCYTRYTLSILWCNSADAGKALLCLALAEALQLLHLLHDKKEIRNCMCWRQHEAQATAWRSGLAMVRCWRRCRLLRKARYVPPIHSQLQTPSISGVLPPHRLGPKGHISQLVCQIVDASCLRSGSIVPFSPCSQSSWEAL